MIFFNRYLVLMRSCYLLSNSHGSLNAELLSRLGLTTSPCWTEEKLCSVQPFLTESLLYYWWVSQFAVFRFFNFDHRGHICVQCLLIYFSLFIHMTSCSCNGPHNSLWISLSYKLHPAYTGCSTCCSCCSVILYLYLSMCANVQGSSVLDIPVCSEGSWWSLSS